MRVASFDEQLRRDDAVVTERVEITWTYLLDQNHRVQGALTKITLMDADFSGV